MIQQIFYVEDLRTMEINNLRDLISVDNLKNNKKFILLYMIFIIVTCFTVFSLENYLHPKNEIIILLMVIIFGILLILFYNKNQKDLYKATLIVILIFGLLCVFLSPINSISDEKEHFIRSEITSNGDFFPEYKIEGNNSGYSTIGSVANAPSDSTPFKASWDSQSINQTRALASSCFAQNPFFGYLAQALGLFIVKLFSLDNIFMIWLGRLFNLLLYASLATIAIKKTPILKMPMFAVACFPLCIIQAASFSIDSAIFGLSLITFAYIFLMYKSKEKSLTKKHILLFFSLIIILGFLKPTLGALALLILIIPKQNFENQRDYYLSVFGIIITLTVLFTWNKMVSIDTLTKSWRGEVFASRNVDPTGQLHYILHNSQSLITFLQIGNQALIMTDALSRIYTNFPTFPLFNITYIIFFGCMCLFYPLYNNFSRNRKICVGLCIIIFIIGTYLVQYLTWAPVGAVNLLDAGVVPRHILPIFLMLPVVFNLNKNNYEIENMNQLVFTCIIGFLASIIIFIASICY